VRTLGGPDDCARTPVAAVAAPEHIGQGDEGEHTDLHALGSNTTWHWQRIRVKGHHGSIKTTSPAAAFICTTSRAPTSTRQRFSEAWRGVRSCRLRQLVRDCKCHADANADKTRSAVLPCSCKTLPGGRCVAGFSPWPATENIGSADAPRCRRRGCRPGRCPGGPLPAWGRSP